MSAQTRCRWTGAPGALLAAALLAAGGCGHFGILVKKKEKAPEPEPVNASLSALAQDSNPVGTPTLSGASPEQPGAGLGVEESARLLEQYLRGIDDAPATVPETTLASNDQATRPPVDPVLDAERRAAEESGGTPTDEPEDGLFTLSDAQYDAPEQEQEQEQADASTAADDQDNDGAEETDPPLEPEPVDPETRKAELIDELKALLASSSRSSSGPAPSAVALAALDAMGPGTLESLYEEGVLSSAEMATLSAARDVLRAIASSESIASPAEVSDVLERVRRELDTSSGMRVTRATLCTSVSGFGLYDEFPTSEFLAGVPHEVIVYVEVDRFAHEEILGEASEPRYEVEMSQRLELYHVADDVNTWNRAAERVTERSRNKVRDFYLTNYVVLPATLRAGSYHLKVVMRDLVGGTVAERVIPLRIVAR